MAKINLRCEQCGGNIMFDNQNKIGTCEHCYTQFVIKEDQIIQHITQNITKHVYGIDAKDIEELLIDAYDLFDIGNYEMSNTKFRQAIKVQPTCWEAWLGYASTGGDCSGYLSIVPAYRQAYNVASNEEQELRTFVDMVQWLPDSHLISAFIRAFNLTPRNRRKKLFWHVSGVIGCDESEMASLAIDICPDDWRAYFALAKFRKIRVKWCELEGGFFSGKYLPSYAVEVLNIFVKAYRLAKCESVDAQKTVLSYIEDMGNEDTYKVFSKELQKAIWQI